MTSVMSERTRPWDDGPVVWTGADVRRLRVAIRMSQRALGAYLGVTGRMVAKWESKGVTPRLVNQRALDEALRRCSPDELRRFRALG